MRGGTLRRSATDDITRQTPIMRHAVWAALLAWILLGVYSTASWAVDRPVLQAQQKLRALGYTPGKADGLWGPRTRKALKAFQRAHNLPVTGALDPQTLQALGVGTQQWISDQALEKVYQEKIRFLHNKLRKYQEIDQRVRAKQRRIDQEKSTHTHRQDDVRKWKSLEIRTRNEMVDIKKAIQIIEARFLKKTIEKFSAEDKMEGRIKQNILLTRMDGKRENIEDYQGAVILLHFWATWCKPCLKEIVALKRVYSRFRTKNFEILAVSLDARKKDIKKFMQRHAINFPVYLDPGRTVYHNIIGGVEVLPRSLLIDKTGRIFHSYAGARQWDSQAALQDIRELLATN